ncbi:MAG: hypothetical protein KDD22_07470 [Bdellovibrionales bacterium]|nr:hypothetical protein [Bdellovibrionales bacterium]
MKLGCNSILILVAILFSLSCTRSKKESQVELSIPIAQLSKAFSATESLTFAAINVRPQGEAVRVKTFEFHDANTSVSDTSAITWTVKDLVVGTQPLVQVLLVFEDSTTGAEKFYYGDQTPTLVSGSQSVNITVAEAGSSNKSYRTTGRYITDANGNGPSGTVAMEVYPKEGAPGMAVEKFDMLNGWFSIFHPGGAIKVAYRHLATDTLLFGGKLAVTSNLFNPTASSTTRAVVIQKPTTYSVYDRTRGPEQIALGYFVADSAGYALSSTDALCYQNYPVATISNYVDTTKTTALVWDPTNTLGGTHAYISSSIGSPTAAANYAAFNSGNCASSNASAMHIYPERLEGREEELVGRYGPFKLIYSEDFHDGYLGREIILDSGTPKYRLFWDIAAKAETSVSGFDIIGKYVSSSGSGSSSSGNKTCQDYLNEGYQVVASAAATAKTMTLPNPLLGQTLTDNNNYQFEFFACAKLSNGNYAEAVVRNRTSFGREMNFGRKSPLIASHNKTLSANTTVTATGMDAGQTRVTNISLDTTNNIATLTLGDPTNLSAGDDMIVGVMSEDAQSATGGCDNSTFNFRMGPGRFTVSRIQSISGANVTVHLDEVISGLGRMDTIANLSGSTYANSTHCFVGVTEILEFGNLTINSNTALSTGNIDLTSGLMGGIIPLRIGGTLTMGSNSYITAEGQGYNGGTNFSESGDGPGGLGQSATPSLGGGAGGGTSMTSGKGGGGFYSALGSDSFRGRGWSEFSGNYFEPRINLGSGGGAGEDSGSVNGSNGGGSILVYANKMNLTATASNNPAFKANGLAPTMATTEYGGGGGGGTISLVTRTITQSGGAPLKFEASALGSPTSSQGGAGFIYVDTCMPTSAALTAVTATSASGSYTPAMASPNIGLFADSQICHNN